jgi:hypothetical protein
MAGSLLKRIGWQFEPAPEYRWRVFYVPGRDGYIAQWARVSRWSDVFGVWWHTIKVHRFRYSYPEAFASEASAVNAALGAIEFDRRCRQSTRMVREGAA